MYNYTFCEVENSCSFHPNCFQSTLCGNKQVLYFSAFVLFCWFYIKGFNLVFYCFHQKSFYCICAFFTCIFRSVYQDIYILNPLFKFIPNQLLTHFISLYGSKVFHTCRCECEMSRFLLSNAICTKNRKLI